MFNGRILAWIIVAVTVTGPVRGDGLPAFPGAEGFGATTTHARGKPVFRVTRLDDVEAQDRPESVQGRGGSGGLRWALTAAGKAGGGYVVFDVAGLIQLRQPLEVPAHVYIAGQSAPGGGIAITGATIIIRGCDVVVRNIRHRGGLGPEGDAFLIEEPAANAVLDHVSTSFFRDGAVDMVGAKDVTIQWSHMGDAIDALTDEPYHCLPNLLRTRTDRITIHHCYYTHAHTRVPMFIPDSYVKDDSARNGLIEFSHNVIYNYRKYPSSFLGPDGKGNAIGNLYVPGRHTHGGSGPRGTIEGANNFTLFVKDNIALSSHPDCPGHDNKVKGDRDDHHVLRGKNAPVAGSRPTFALPETAILHQPKPGTFNVADERFAEIPPLTYQPLPEAVNAVMTRFGALPHDATDQRLQRELLTHTGEWKMKMPDDKNVYQGRAEPDGDGDGMPDVWERKRGRDLTPNGHDLDERYENLEVYLQERMDQFVKAVPPVTAWERLTGSR
jgi:hypothetical protein